MALMQITVLPIGTDSASVGDFVAEIQKALLSGDTLFTLTDMGTIIEGQTTELLALAARLHEMPFNKGVQRVVTQISIDERRDKNVSLGDKTHSVEERL